MTRNGIQRPTMIAASAINPRPFVIPSVKVPSSCKDNTAPPSPAIAAPASVRIATPLLFAALGGLLSESAGTFAVGIEGMMLMGAFGGAIARLICHSAVAGLLASAISGATL